VRGPCRRISRLNLAEIVEPRYEELLMLVQAELRRSGFEDLIAAGIVLSGGSARVEGLVELAEGYSHACSHWSAAVHFRT
jgi:cell division protein FtsA